MLPSTAAVHMVRKFESPQKRAVPYSWREKPSRGGSYNSRHERTFPATREGSSARERGASDRGEGADRAREEREPVDATAHGRCGVRAEAGLGRVLRMRHEADHIAARIRDPGDVVHRTVRVDAEVTERHLALALDTLQLVGGRDESALAVLQRDDDLGIGLEL